MLHNTIDLTMLPGFNLHYNNYVQFRVIYRMACSFQMGRYPQSNWDNNQQYSRMTLYILLERHRGG